MKNIFKMSRHATNYVYMYDEGFIERKPVVDDDNITIGGLKYVPLMDFDLTSLAGKIIKAAVLTLQVSGDEYPQEIEITSVSHDWNSRFVSNYCSDKEKAWLNDKWLTDMIMGNGNSAFFREKTNYDGSEGILKVNVNPQIIYAMINRQSYGFGIVDYRSKAYYMNGKNQEVQRKRFNVNPGKGSVPMLEIEYDEAEFAIPSAPFALKGIGLENSESFENTDVLLQWSFKPDKTEEYRYFSLYMSEKKVPVKEMVPVSKYFIPQYQPGKAYVGTEIQYLKPNTNYWFALTVSNNGYTSKPIYTKVKTLGARKCPVLEACKAERAENSSSFLEGEGYRVYIIDEISKVNPVNGNVLEAGPEVYGGCSCSNIREYNSGLFNENRVGIKCIPGEKYGIQFVYENKDENAKVCKVEIESSTLDSRYISLSRAWYLKCKDYWYPEAAIPVEQNDKFQIPFIENKVPGQKFQSIYMDLNLTGSQQAGTYEFVVKISDNTETVVIPVAIEVLDLKLQDSGFIFDLISYLNPPLYMDRKFVDKDYYSVEKAYYIEAYKHNTNISTVPYTHFGMVQEGYAPRIGFVDGKPAIVDWSEFDEHFGKYFDGSYILETAGKRVPITHFYLPFYENWPMPIDEYYKIKIQRAEGDTEDYPDIINEHMLKSDSLYKDFLPGYREGIKSVMKDFISHIEEKNWKEVKFQFCLNNKEFHKMKRRAEKRGVSGEEHWLMGLTCSHNGGSKSWWLLDEPMFRTDWEALRYFGSILKEAKKETGTGENISFRVDISAYNVMFRTLDGILENPVIASRAFDALEPIIRKRKAKFGESPWIYGGWSGISESSFNTLSWTLDSYLKGAEGLIPYNNFARDTCYEIPTETAILYPGNRWGLNGPIPSIRLRAAKKAQEIIRYLHTLKHALGYSDCQLREYTTAYIELAGFAVVRFDEDAGIVRYGGRSKYMDLERMREDIIRNLMAFRS